MSAHLKPSTNLRGRAPGRGALGHGRELRRDGDDARRDVRRFILRRRNCSRQRQAGAMDKWGQIKRARLGMLGHVQWRVT